MKLNLIGAAAATAMLVSSAWGKAIEATDKTLPGLVDKKVPMLLDIYASWCGHCKRLGPIWDELADKFDNAQDKVQIVKIDGDKHSKTAKKYNVEYFPTLKFIDAEGNVEDIKDRDLESLTKLVQTKTKVGGGGSAAAKKDPVSQVVALNDANFEQKLKEKPALVAFKTDWCGHCKRLVPTWDELSTVFSRDDVVIGSVDCTGEEATSLMEKYQIQSFPTIMYFPAGGSEEPVPYTSGRTLEQFVEWVNDKAGLFRDQQGGLTEFAGRVESLDKTVKKLVKGESTTDKLEKAAKKLGNEGKLYARYAQKYAKDGAAYVEKETSRLQKIISGGKIAPQKLDELVKKYNVLSQFALANDEDESDKDEL